ncbi:MAG: aminopeptidase P family protein [Gemmatimonadota bacterium]|nr:aminopeptidase P family protein [Gemmatimonadota bacterium]MDH5804582.1 aminopeptidase P family protein [Gemmatimonadota bacterium]
MRILIILLALAVPLPVLAQGVDFSWPLEEDLPGAGRAIDREATAGRRARLVEELGPSVFAVYSGDMRDLEADVLQDNDFRANDYFHYLTSLEAPQAWLLIVTGPDGSSETKLYLPQRRPDMERWTGKKLGPGERAVQLTGIEEVISTSSLPDFEELASSLGVPLYTVQPRAANGHSAPVRSEDGATQGGVRDARPVLDGLRLIKDEDELGRLRRAIGATVAAHRQAMRAVQPGWHEYQVEAIVEYTFRFNGAERVGFPSIIGSGPNSTTLHYDVNRRRIEDGDLIVIDIGAEFGQYSADVTRTIPVNGRFTPRQRAIYELVLGAQQAAIDMVKPGVTVRDLTIRARAYIDEHSGDLCQPSSCNAYFIHGLSHWLGMRVHDVGDYSRVLEPGMVLTIEPGIYIEAEELGVRIEDDILVTADGAVVLSEGAPRSVDDIEALMRETPIFP